LWNGDPRILVLPDGANAFFMTPDTLSEPEAAAITSRIRAAIAETGTGKGPVGPQLDQ
jgi:hypothetical protein